jgi:transposase InsO family protein
VQFCRGGCRTRWTSPSASPQEGLAKYGAPKIFKTDQGSQFTSTAFTGVLVAAGIAISMDGRGRSMDNVFIERLWRSLKHEDIYLKGYADGGEACAGHRGVDGVLQSWPAVTGLTRALEILNVLAEHGEGMSLTELARATKLAPSTAHRLLTTLQQDRFVQFESGPGLWLVGATAIALLN